MTENEIINAEKKCFYEWASSELSYSRNNVILILKGMNYTSFKLEEVEEYKEKLQEYMLSERRVRTKKKYVPLRENVPCPLKSVLGVSCNGFLLNERPRRCSIGGFSHVMASKLLAEDEDFDVVAFLRGCHSVKEQKAKEQKDQAAYWREQMAL